LNKHNRFISPHPSTYGERIMKRNFLIIFSLSIVLILMLTGTGFAEISCSPNEYNVDLVKGKSRIYDIIIENTGDSTISGNVFVRNVRCGTQCPNATLSINVIELGAGESVNATIYVYSHPDNDCQEIILPIVFEDENGNSTNIGQINIKVHLDY